MCAFVKLDFACYLQSICAAHFSLPFYPLYAAFISYFRFPTRVAVFAVVVNCMFVNFCLLLVYMFILPVCLSARCK